jgi:hypothetical protein
MDMYSGVVVNDLGTHGNDISGVGVNGIDIYSMDVNDKIAFYRGDYFSAAYHVKEKTPVRFYKLSLSVFFFLIERFAPAEKSNN